MKPDAIFSTWAAWCIDGRPLSFSVLRDSIIAQAFQPHHKKTYRSDRPLWRETGTDWLHELDGRLSGTLSAPERRTLVAAYAPLGRRATLQERAALAGESERELRRVKQRAYKVLRNR